MFLPERALDTNCHTSCLVDTHANTHTHILKDSKSVCLETCQPEGCDIVVRDPKEVDNSTASGMLGPEGKN